MASPFSPRQPSIKHLKCSLASDRAKTIQSVLQNAKNQRVQKITNTNKIITNTNDKTPIPHSSNHPTTTTSGSLLNNNNDQIRINNNSYPLPPRSTLTPLESQSSSVVVSERLKELREKSRLLDNQIQDEEGIRIDCIRKEKVDAEKIRSLVQRFEEESRSMASERKAKLEKARLNELDKEIDYHGDYTAIYGVFVRNRLHVNYKRRVGRCLCPELKVCSSVDGSEIKCDFWKCPKLTVKKPQPNPT